MGEPGHEFRVAFDEAFRDLRAEIQAGCPSPAPWPRSVVGAVGAAFTYAAREPDAARILTVEPTRDIDQGAEAAEHLNDTLARQLLRITGELAGPEMRTERVLVGAVVAVVRRRVVFGDLAALPGMADEVAEILLIPYLGTELAHATVTGHRA